MAYLLQEQGYDTVEANLGLGFVDDARNYNDAIRVLGTLRQKPVTLITNNPRKLDALREAGLDVSARIPLWGTCPNIIRNICRPRSIVRVIWSVE